MTTLNKSGYEKHIEHISMLFNQPKSSMLMKIEMLLINRGVHVKDIAEIVLETEQPYNSDLTLNDTANAVRKVLSKRETQNAIFTGINLDILSENGMLFDPFQDIVHSDNGLYGVDEIIATGIANLFGSIGITNYGYLDKTKPGIIGTLNQHNNGKTHTFLDDLVGAVAAAACAKLSHEFPEKNEVIEK